MSPREQMALYHLAIKAAGSEPCLIIKQELIKVAARMLLYSSNPANMEVTWLVSYKKPKD